MRREKHSALAYINRTAFHLEGEGRSIATCTLLFFFAQARARTKAGIFLISPFIGRILSTTSIKAKKPAERYRAERDSGMLSVQKICDYYKRQRYNTEIMGASFRKVEQIQSGTDSSTGRLQSLGYSHRHCSIS
ncbi:MAG: transaldolase family protein [Symbiopectobacterium sp.]